MKTEIDYAANFLVSTIKEKLTLSEQQLQTLQKRLPELINERYENHWYEDKPMKGSAFRCINVSVEDNSVDIVLRQVAEDSDITVEELLHVFDEGLALWVDPNDVSCRLGKGAIFPIYKKIAESKQTRTDLSPQAQSFTSNHHRPQQRPRSTSPPPMFNYSSQQQQQLRPRSTTPPGFTSMDAGKMFKTVPTSVNYNYSSTDNLHKVWNSIPNTTSYTSYNYSPTSYVSTYTSSTYGINNSNDSAYSFNQYSSYYNPNASWKKSARNHIHQELKPLWQEDHIYNRYHWSRDDNVGENNLSCNNNNNIQSYGRQVQEVC